MSLLQRMHNRQRGAAMTEFVLLVPVMIMMWMGIEYFRSGYARRLDALARSQTQAWTLAYSNDMSCYWGGLNVGGLAGIGAELSGGGSTADTAISTFSSSGSSSAFIYGDARGDKTLSTKTAGWDLTQGTVRGRTIVACDEVVPGPNKDQDILTPLGSFVKGLFPSL